MHHKASEDNTCIATNFSVHINTVCVQYTVHSGKLFVYHYFDKSCMLRWLCAMADTQEKK